MGRLLIAFVAVASASLFHRHHDAERAHAESDIRFSRSVDSVASGYSGKVTVDQGCSSSDQYGSNDCAFAWGETLKVDATVAAGADIAAGAKFVVDAKIDSIVPFKAECAACGANCTITVPIVKKEITVAMPPCPLVAKGKTLSTEIPLSLPAKSPLPVKVSAKGNAKLVAADGSTIASVDFDATVE